MDKNQSHSESATIRVNQSQKYSESSRVRQNLESVRVKVHVHGKVPLATQASAYWARTNPLTVPDRQNQDCPSQGLQYKPTGQGA